MSVFNATLPVGRRCKKLDVDISDAVSNVTCPSGSTACEAVWRENNNEIEFIKQDCLPFENEGAPTERCSENACVAYVHTPPDVGMVYVCCCKSDYCNSHVSNGNITTNTEPYESSFLHNSSSKGEENIQIQDKGMNLIIILVAAAAFLIAFVVACKKYGPRVINYMNSENHEISDEENVTFSTTCSICVDDYFESNSHVSYQGRYGKIYLMTVRPTDWSNKKDSTKFCIKEFDVSNVTGRQMYVTERKCYQLLSNTEHRNVPRYYGSLKVGRYTICNIMLEYCSRGSLRDCLRTTTFDTTNCLEILRDVTAAIDFLHNPHDTERCAIAHRDITSANFLVKDDWTVVVTDFGLSQILSKQGDDNNTDLRGVGTVYYLAPEILAGTCNLRFKNAALKQADVYSMSLVIWEVASRCHEFYNNTSLIPESQIPYKKETRNVQQLIDLVVEQGFRPKFPFAEDLLDENNSLTKSVSEYNITDTDSHHRDALFSQSDDQDSCSTVSTVVYQSELSSSHDDSSSMLTTDSESVANIRSEVRRRSELSPKRLAVQKCAKTIVRSLKESWDADEEARLTSSTVYNRMIACLEEYSSLL